ncbi:MAG: hypothetical protein M1834_003822 [Cirrosporium novae-zelandiae]|nr:MAG: hypothetical protein M1834_003822 [Cirrosporium novae-zelandiae]
MASDPQNSGQKPNILYIMADQMAAPMLRMYDPESRVKTPNLDHLAKNGVVFDQAYCNSPLCAPSRFALVTGRLPSKIGAFDNASDLPADVVTYAHYLRAAGYHTALAGKMHYIGPDQLHGYEQRLTSDIYPGDYGWSVNWDEPEVRLDFYHNMSSVLDAGPCGRSNQLDYDNEVIYKSNQYLWDHVRHRGDQPFCLTVSMTHPHDPYTMEQEYWDLYEDVEIPMPKTAAIPQDKQDPHSQRILKCIDLWGSEIPEERIRAARRAYFAACTYVDDQIGKLLKTLKATGMADNTIIIFSGDHGDMLGERGLWYKMAFFEMSARVPMLVYKPGLYAPHRVHENVSTLDLLPTFVDMAGGARDLRLPVDGTSLMPYIAQIEGPRPDTVIGEYMGEGTLAPLVMIRRDRWKFIYSPLDPPMLFDLVADPLERTNLVAGLPIPTRSQKSVRPLPNLHLPFAPVAMPSPPHTPSPGTIVPASATNTTTSHSDPSVLLALFLEEVSQRWNFDALTKKVLESQRRRRVIWSALSKGVQTSWDYTPIVDGGSQYVRNMGKGILDDVEWHARWPRV